MRVGILGFGSIGQRHWRNLQTYSVPSAWHDPFVSFSLNRDVVISQSDAIIVCTPTKEHSKDFMDVLDAGKHLLIEKPIGYDCPPLFDGFLQGLRMKDPKRIVATGFMCRFHHCVQHAKRLLANGVLGDIQAASFSVLQKTEKPDYLRDGIIRNWLSHEIDLAHHFFGPGQVISCTVNDTEDANLVMKFPTVQDRVFINGDYITEPHQRYFWIEGSKASIYVNLERREIYKRTNKSYSSPTLEYQSQDTWDQAYIEELGAFLKSIETGIHQYPLATGEDGVRSLYSVMDAYSIAQTGNIIPNLSNIVK